MGIGVRLLIPAVAVLSGCSGPGLRPSFDSIDPQERTLALGQAAARGDQARIPEFIVMLDSPDPAERMLAIRTLERWTGQTHGYDFAASPAQRARAVQEWLDWANAEGFVDQ